MLPIQNSNGRKHYLDWLRVIAFYLLIFFHVGMIFVPWDFHIKNDVTLEWFETWMAFLSQWRLPLLFLISGMVIFYSIGKRSAKEVIKERNRRLMIPLLVGIFIIVPPQIYFERISDGLVFANYFEFWKTVFEFIPFPEGGSLSWHHLWYVLYIFVYTLI
jgi:surface polysaccharide O-acyltransferase-like enzyme